MILDKKVILENRIGKKKTIKDKGNREKIKKRI